MKTIISMAILLFSHLISAQTINLTGHIQNEEDKSSSIGVNIYLMQNGVIKYGGITDENGNYYMNNVPIGFYDLKLSFLGYKDQLLLNLPFDASIKKADFLYPTVCKKSNRICPYGHKNDIIKIVYGLPTDKVMKEADEGKIKLGGCITSNCDPKWFCKQHEIEF